MKQASLLNTKSEPPSDVPEPDSIADSIRNRLGETSTSKPVDPELAHCLSSEAVMSGESSRHGESVWAILQRLGPKRNQQQEQIPEQEPERSQDIMVYGPLLPDSNSDVELADSEEVLEYVDDADQQIAKKAEGQTARTKVHREWRPSTSKISLQATWWGFRLYLPPPVLAILSDAHLAAAKRGAIITAALKWLLDRTPVMLVPPTVRPAIATLKRLAPYLGYVGAFVAWSWERIKKKDKGSNQLSFFEVLTLIGNGVVLSATWILPIALVPSTWEP